MYGKIQILGTLDVVTGMHIGGNSAFSAIGAVDSPVMKDAKSKLPLIPGSSFKGKLRALLARQYNTKLNERPEDDHRSIVRLFGSAKKEQVMRSRLLFSDMFLSNVDELKKRGGDGLTTEVKFENTINRLTGVANPRQIERVVRGAKFDFDIIYEVECEEEIVEDLKVLATGFKLLQYDYLGGHGSRGYGKVKFSDMDVDVVVGDIKDSIMEECRRIIEEV